MLLRTYKSKNMRGWHVGHGRLSGKGTRLDIGGSRLSVSTLLLAELTLGYIEESVMLLEVEYGHSLQEKTLQTSIFLQETPSLTCHLTSTSHLPAATSAE